MDTRHSHYLTAILTSAVYDAAAETPLEAARNLSGRLKNNILLKREDLQPVFSFKIRGAYNKMAALGEAELKRGVITASAGNHAQGVALSAQKLGCEATIVMPETTPQIKVDAVKSRGGKVVLHGTSYNDAYDHAMRLVAQSGLTYIPPFTPNTSMPSSSPSAAAAWPPAWPPSSKTSAPKSKSSAWKPMTPAP